MSLLHDIVAHSEMEPSQLMAYIDDYEALQPYDCMIGTARAVVSFFAGDYETAETHILRALKKNPGNYMNHFYYALIAKSLGQYLTTAVECWTAISFATQFGVPEDWDSLAKQLNDVLTEVGSRLSPQEKEEFVVSRNILRSPGSFFPAYYLYDQERWTVFMGRFLYFDRKKKYNHYVGFWGQAHMDIFSNTLQQLLCQSNSYNAYSITPTETWKAIKTRQFALDTKGCVMAVAATAINQTITIQPSKGKPAVCTLVVPDIYHYLNMDQIAKLSSPQDFIVSKPISTRRQAGKKRLILTIFMDALSQRYLTDTDFQDMPYTKEFFGAGTIFKNCYSTGEWTHPSVAALNTGLYTTHHHIIYRSSAYRYPDHTKTIGEIFNENGYFTVSVSGSVGTSPYLRGLRGYDCAICKSCMGFPDAYLIADAMDFMEAFSNSSKYLALGLFDVHRTLEDTSDSVPNLALAQQTTLSFHDGLAKTGEGKKSVWMHHSEVYVKKYQAALRDCDRKLKTIFDYISSHYREEEYVVCFYSDHGTPVLSKEDYLLKTMQTNSVLMLRGSGVPAQISEEYVNHFDYIPALAKLSGIPFDFSGYDCVLPKAFGGPGRDFVYTESIYHGQSYKAAIRTEEFECRFETNGLTDNDGLIDLSQGFSQKIFSMHTGDEIRDGELEDEFEAIVFDHIKENIKY